MYNYIIEKATRTGSSHERHGLPNEDCAVVVQRDNCIWMGVFDGVSTGGGGKIAATLAGECMNNILKTNKFYDIYNQGSAIIRDAQKSILRTNAAHPEYGKMQTTAAIACLNLSEHSLTWFSIGDSAVFVCPKRKKSIKLTIEDTDIGELLFQGKISQKTAAQATVGHELKRWLGMDTSPEEIQKYVRTGQREITNDDIVIVCSDGFYSKVSPKIINRSLRKNEKADSLVKAAKDLGSQDDITVICAKPEANIQKKHTPIGVVVAMAFFFFSCGFFCGAELSDLMKEKTRQLRPFIQEDDKHVCPADTLTIKSKENEAFEIIPVSFSRNRPCIPIGSSYISCTDRDY